MPRDTLVVIDAAAWGLRLTLAVSWVPRRPVLALVVERCPTVRGGRVLRLWRWYAESSH